MTFRAFVGRISSSRFFFRRFALRSRFFARSIPNRLPRWLFWEALFEPMSVISEEVQYWFEQAVDVPADNRLSFLESSCRNESVRTQVLSLLKYDIDDSESPLDIPVPEGMKDVFKEALECILGNDKSTVPVQRVGPFELGRLLGSGGMGSVYEAHRVDGEVRQRVAVKFAQVLTGNEKVRESAHRRFCRERQMLASLTSSIHRGPDRCRNYRRWHPLCRDRANRWCAD